MTHFGIRTAFAALLMLATGPAAAQCTDEMLAQIGSGTTWCQSACAALEGSPTCDALRYMQSRAALGDISGVRDGYVACRANPYDQSIADTCNWLRPTEFLAVARNALGAPSGAGEPSPTQSDVAQIPSAAASAAGSEVKSVAPASSGATAAPTAAETAMPAAGTEPATTANGGSFPVSQALDASPDDQLALIGTIEVPAVGALETLDLQFYRNNRQTWLVSIDRITVETAGGKTLIHLSMWDRLRQDVRPLNYRIEGTVTLSASGK